MMTVFFVLFVTFAAISLIHVSLYSFHRCNDIKLQLWRS